MFLVPTTLNALDFSQSGFNLQIKLQVWKKASQFVKLKIYYFIKYVD